MKEGQTNGGNWRGKRTKDKWRNIITFITASLAQEEDEPNHEKQEQINSEMYQWLMSNFTLVRKKKKVTIFDVMKNKIK